MNAIKMKNWIAELKSAKITKGKDGRPLEALGYYDLKSLMIQMEMRRETQEALSHPTEDIGMSEDVE